VPGPSVVTEGLRPGEVPDLPPAALAAAQGGRAPHVTIVCTLPSGVTSTFSIGFESTQDALAAHSKAVEFLRGAAESAP